jgi:hypothetical protein
MIEEAKKNYIEAYNAILQYAAAGKIKHDQARFRGMLNALGKAGLRVSVASAPLPTFRDA